MSKILSILLAGSVVFTLAACQKSNDAPAGNDTLHPLYLGDLDKKLNDIYSKENEDMMNACDRQWRPKILEIARVLEEKRKDIEVLAKAQNSQNNIVGIDFGSFKFVDDSDRTAGKDEWSSYHVSWSQIADDYDYIKDDPQNPYWVNLNHSARGIVTDDDARITYGRFYGLSKDSGPVITAIKDKFETCLENTSCTMPDLTKAELNYLRENIYYDHLYIILRSGKRSYSEKRDALTRFTNRLRVNADRYGFRKESLIRVEGKTLVIPMDLTALGEDGANKFMALVEKAWNIDPEYSIKIESVTNPVLMSYKVQVDQELGGRAFVMWDDRLMQLHNWGRFKTIAHEFGHVLGFKDNYYTTWSTETCAYSYQSNAGDLMSDSSAGGVVLPLHWAKLKEIYWPETSKPETQSP